MSRVFVYPSVQPLDPADARAERTAGRRALPREQRDLVRESLLRCPDTDPSEGSER